MIVPTETLRWLAGKVTMADGGFDPLHAGHVAYLRAAAKLGLPVLCNVSSDDWIRRKHPPLLPHAERGAVVDAIRWVSYVHLAETPTVDVLRLLRPRYYVKGEDWRDRLPEAETAACGRYGIDVVFLDTVSQSSTDLLSAYARNA